MENFTNRIIPAIEQQQRDVDELSRLRAQLKDANSELARSKSRLQQQGEQIQILKRERNEANQLLSEALSTSDGAVEDIRRLTAENDKLVHLERELKAENTHLKGVLENHSKAVRLILDSIFRSPRLPKLHGRTDLRKPKSEGSRRRTVGYNRSSWLKRVLYSTSRLHSRATGNRSHSKR